ncbi:hypothetical protein [Anaplasma phagocytophilum]|uniref:hypothetical protein n=1 Tax=Anaplasma phagocytophilum TaxID=948 RepID=UPI0012BD1EB7|nr:hypothetical protein [Anaplasma phagocytophilum]
MADSEEFFAHEVLSQVEHFAYGGVVSEIAAHAHYDFLKVLGNKALSISRSET